MNTPDVGTPEVSLSLQEKSFASVTSSLRNVPPWSLYTLRQRWIFLFILFLVTTSNYFDYFILSVMLEPIKHEFHVSDTMLGLLSGFCFALFYAFTALPIASWSDRGNRRTVISLSLSAWSVMTAVCGVAGTFGQLALARFLVGAVEPGALPPAQSLVADYFPPERRALAVSILSQGGSAAGWLVGIGLGGYIVATHGWRIAFVMAGVPGILLALVARFALSEPRLAVGFPNAGAHAESTLETLRHLKCKNSYLFALLGLSLYAVFSYGVATFVPSFMVRSLHASLEQISVIWGSIIAIANLGGAVIGGWLADVLGKRDVRWYAWIPAGGCALAVAAYGTAFCMWSPSTFIATDFVAEFLVAAGTPSAFVAIHAVCGNQRRTMAVATAMLLFSLLGSGVGPPVVGIISDMLGSLYGSDSLRLSLLTLLLFLAPAAIAFGAAGRAMRADLED
jgi:MFS family permease